MPFSRVARCSAGKLTCGNSVTWGTPVLRSTPSVAALYSGKGRITSVWSPWARRFLPMSRRSRAEASSTYFMLSRKQPGSPVYTAQLASTSDLPPNPPMRSTPRMKSARTPVLARASSARLGPLRSSSASSSSMIASTRAGSTPSLTFAMTMNSPESSSGMLKALTKDTSSSSNTSRVFSREEPLPPSTWASSASWSASAVP